MVQKVPVAVWKITDAADYSLDRCESFLACRAKRRRLAMDDGTELLGMLYTINLLRLQPPAACFSNAIAYAYEKPGIGNKIDTVLELRT